MRTYTIEEIHTIFQQQAKHTEELLGSYQKYQSDDSYDDLTSALDITRWMLDFDMYPSEDAIAAFKAFVETEHSEDLPKDLLHTPPFTLNEASCDGICDPLDQILKGES